MKLQNCVIFRGYNLFSAEEFFFRSKLIKLPFCLCTCVNVPFQLLLFSILTEFQEIWYKHYVPGRQNFLISYGQ
jgi:hypothetical protein